MSPEHCAKLSEIARRMAERGDAQVLTTEDAANDPNKCPPLDGESEATLRKAYALTAFPAHGLSFETVLSTDSYHRALRNIAAHLRETGRL